MARTSPRVSFGLFAMSVKQDAVFTCPDEQPFSKVADLKTGNVVTRPLISYEPDFWLLSGEYKIKPVSDTAVRVGLMSLSMSDATGEFATPPVLTITFSQPQTADSLNIRFAQASDDYASDLDIAYYDADDALIVTTNYTPDNVGNLYRLGSKRFSKNRCHIQRNKQALSVSPRYRRRLRDAGLFRCRPNQVRDGGRGSEPAFGHPAGKHA
jgi:hypothetical protein